MWASIHDLWRWYIHMYNMFFGIYLWMYVRSCTWASMKMSGWMPRVCKYTQVNWCIYMSEHAGTRVSDKDECPHVNRCTLYTEMNCYIPCMVLVRKMLLVADTLKWYAHMPNMFFFVYIYVNVCEVMYMSECEDE